MIVVLVFMATTAVGMKHSVTAGIYHRMFIVNEWQRQSKPQMLTYKRFSKITQLIC